MNDPRPQNRATDTSNRENVWEDNDDETEMVLEDTDNETVRLEHSRWYVEWEYSHRTSAMPHERPPLRIYLAAPMTTYRTERYNRIVSQLQHHFAGDRLLSARYLYTSTADWRMKWPKLLPTLDALLFIAAEDGTIGSGVLREIIDVRNRGRPVHYVSESEYIPLQRVHFQLPERPTSYQFLRVHIGPRRFARIYPALEPTDEIAYVDYELND